jgi:FMN-binding domain
MNWQPLPFVLLGIGAYIAPISSHAKIYVSIEQAQALLIPNQALTPTPLLVTKELQEKLRLASGIRHPFQGDQIWQAKDGSWFVVDEVVGKHEMIQYAVALSPRGAVLGVEILQYVESYGYEVANPSWRKQFSGKQVNDPIKLNQDIQNIGGATLSCKHLTDGIKRVVMLYELALKDQTPQTK